MLFKCLTIVWWRHVRQECVIRAYQRGVSRGHAAKAPSLCRGLCVCGSLLQSLRQSLRQSGARWRRLPHCAVGSVCGSLLRSWWARDQCFFQLWSKIPKVFFFNYAISFPASNQWFNHLLFLNTELLEIRLLSDINWKAEYGDFRFITQRLFSSMIVFKWVT